MMMVMMMVDGDSDDDGVDDDGSVLQSNRLAFAVSDTGSR